MAVWNYYFFISGGRRRDLSVTPGPVHRDAVFLLDLEQYENKGKIS